MITEKTLNTKECFFIRNGQILTRISLKDIRWINSDKNYLTIFTSDKKYLIKASLKKMESFLPETQFVRVHRSYLVRTNLIDSIDFSSHELNIGESILPIGRRYKDALLDKLELL